MGEWRDSFAQLLAQLKGELQNYRTKLLSCMNSVTAAAQENMATDLAFLKKHPHVLNPELPSYRYELHCGCMFVHFLTGTSKPLPPPVASLQ